MSATLTTAVIGTGAISQEHLDFLSRERVSHIVGVCDLSRASARYAASRFPDARAFTNHHEMLDTLRPDVVHVLTPPQTHAAICRDCLEAGAHVFVEKPVALTYEDFQKLWTTAERYDRRLIEDHNYRFNTPVQTLEQLVAEGQLGEVREVEVRMALALHRGNRYNDPHLPHPSHQLPAGVIHEFLPHLAYLALRFLPRVDRVVAAWRNESGNPAFQYDDLDALVFSSNIHARLRFSCHTQPDCFTVTLRGTEGWAQADLFHPCVQTSWTCKAGPFSPLLNQMLGGAVLLSAGVANLRRKILQETPYEGMHRLLRMTYECLHRGEEPPITFDDMDRTSRLIDSLLDEANRL